MTLTDEQREEIHRLADRHWIARHIATAVGVTRYAVEQELQGKVKPGPSPGVSFKACKPYWCDSCGATVNATPCPTCFHRALRAEWAEQAALFE